MKRIDITDPAGTAIADMDALPVLPTRNLVLFPGVTVPITLSRSSAMEVAEAAKERNFLVGIFCQTDPDKEIPDVNDIHHIGVTARVHDIINLPDGDRLAVVSALEKIKVDGAALNTDVPEALFCVRARPVHETMPRKNDREFPIIMESLAAVLSQLVSGGDGVIKELSTHLKQFQDNPSLFINFICTNAPFPIPLKISFLTCSRLKERAIRLLGALNNDREKARMLKDVEERTKAFISEQQRKSVLMAQYTTIRRELFGDEDADVLALRSKRLDMALPQEVADIFEQELQKLERMSRQSPEYSVQHNYLTTLLELPWNVTTDTPADFAEAERVLEQDHYGLEKVKERILEQLAVIINAPRSHAPILCLVGAPGVGKTSLGASIARAMGRKYERVALGGLHDEAEIRGHRRTYIGAMPGRIITALRRAGAANPVILLDEIDKMGSDFRGDPSAALLEVLDPEQNHRFHDNFIDLDFDLSKVLFIATANTLASVPQPLLDRMEVIDIAGYLPDEKVEIARRHLLPRLAKAMEVTLGEGPDALMVPDETILAIIERYTAESGVRLLEKHLASLLRKSTLRRLRDGSFPSPVTPQMLTQLLGVPPFIKERCEQSTLPGVVTGLAWTQAGGEILFIECSAMPPAKPGEQPQPPVLTGNLGDVMKESAVIARRYVAEHAAEFGIAPEVVPSSLHIHVPEGAIPKDGPSAGITMATAIASALSRRPVRPRLAMTGEITLRGKVLPVGGIKEKILAAKRAGVTTIIISEANRKDVDDIKETYRAGLDFIYVETVAQVIAAALLPPQ